MNSPTTETERFLVVVNHEEQYAIWPVGAQLPAVPSGWSVVAGPRDRDECLQHIREVWVDLRPKSLRESMATRSTQGRTTDE